MTRDQIIGLASALILATILGMARSMRQFIRRVNRATLAINGDEELGIPSIVERIKTTDKRLTEVDERVGKIEALQERHVITHHPTVNAGRARPRTQE